MDLQILRRETRDDHASVEGAVPLMHARLNAAEYVQCLQRMHGVVAGWEEYALKAAPEWMKPAVAARQRRQLLERDLAWFGVVVGDDGRAVMPEMSGLAGLFGAMYVMEGSTLGGQFIARHVETVLKLSEGQGNSYFRGHGSKTGPMWKEFCEMLTVRIPEEETETVVVSAKAMFVVFGRWMQGNRALDGE